MAGKRVVYEPRAEVLGTLSNNDTQPRRANRKRSSAKGQKPKGACEGAAGRRRGRSGSCPHGPTRSGKRRTQSQNGANRRSSRHCAAVHATAVDQLSLMLAASQLGGVPYAQHPPPLFSGSFILTGDVILEEDDADAEVDHYAERAQGCVQGVQEPDPEEEAIAAALAQTYETTDTMLKEHATRHQECIVQRWRAQQNHSTHTTVNDSVQNNARKPELIDDIEDTEHTFDQLSPTGSRSTDESGSQSPVTDAPDSPADERYSRSNGSNLCGATDSAENAEQIAQAEELKEQGHALMAVGDFINAGGIFGIARKLNPADTELRELEVTADRMAERAVEVVHRPTTKRCSQYSRIYDAWLSSGRPEMDSPVSMAVC